MLRDLFYTNDRWFLLHTTFFDRLKDKNIFIIFIAGIIIGSVFEYVSSILAI